MTGRKFLVCDYLNFVGNLMGSEGRLRKIYLVTDQMITMHAILRDRNQRLALAVDLLLLGSSTVLCATVFLDFKILAELNLTPATATLIIGFCSIITFLISLISLRVNWKQKAESHGQAVIALLRLKFEIRSLLNLESEEKQKKVEEQILVYERTVETLPNIPENKFHKLKAAHRRKVEFSKFIDKHPSAPYFLLKVLFLFEALKNGEANTSKE